LKTINWIARVILLLLYCSQSNAQSATIITDTSLYQRPSLQSSVENLLKAGTPVTVLSRLGGWKQVSYPPNKASGWVRSYKVRTGTIIISEKEQQSGGFFSGLASLSRKASGLFSSDKKGYSFQRTATIGVRGLSEEQIKNAKPDLEQLKKMESFRSNKKKAKKYAQKGQLKTRRINHMPKSGAEK